MFVYNMSFSREQNMVVDGLAKMASTSVASWSELKEPLESVIQILEEDRCVVIIMYIQLTGYI